MSRSKLTLPMFIIGCIGVQLAGCATSGPAVHSRPSATGNQTAEPTKAADPAQSTRPIAFIAGDPVTWQDLIVPLAEAQGGQVLAERVLERQVRRRLAQRGLQISDQDIEAEEQLLLSSLSTDADRAWQLLSELRQRRGMGEYRWRQSLRTRAGMRALVRDQVQITDEALRAAYQLKYGPRYEARLIVVPTPVEAGQVVRKAHAGESFIDLAIAHSTDSSRAQGGLLDPISPADPTYPQAIRDALARLKVGQVSDPVLLDQGVAILKLERKIDAQSVQFDDVKEELERFVRQDTEQQLMHRLTRTLLQETKVIVMDPTLGKSWEQLGNVQD